jgi:hypothetical protein
MRAERYEALARAALGLDDPFPLVPRTLDADRSRREVDVLNPQRPKLTVPETREKRRRPQNPITLGQRVQQRRRLRRRRDPLPSTLNGRKLKVGGRVDEHLPAPQRSAVDHP